MPDYLDGIPVPFFFVIHEPANDDVYFPSLEDALDYTTEEVNRGNSYASDYWIEQIVLTNGEYKGLRSFTLKSAVVVDKVEGE